MQQNAGRVLIRTNYGALLLPVEGNIFGIP